MNQPRHSWGEPVRFPYKTERTCKHEGCSVVRVTKHEPDGDWIEFWDGLDRLGLKTPPCVAKEQKAA